MNKKGFTLNLNMTFFLDFKPFAIYFAQQALLPVMPGQITCKVTVYLIFK